MLDIKKILKALNSNDVKYIVIGATAAIAQGSVNLSFDFDICYSRDINNLENIVKALTDFRPYLRGAPKDLPFIFDAKSLQNGLNFTFSSDVGDIDLIGEMKGIGFYNEALRFSKELIIYDGKCCVLTIEGLIKNKRAVGREKDIKSLIELEALLEIQKRQKKKKD